MVIFSSLNNLGFILLNNSVNGFIKDFCLMMDIAMMDNMLTLWCIVIRGIISICFIFRVLLWIR